MNTKKGTFRLVIKGIIFLLYSLKKEILLKKKKGVEVLSGVSGHTEYKNVTIYQAVTTLGHGFHLSMTQIPTGELIF